MAGREAAVRVADVSLAGADITHRPRSTAPWTPALHVVHKAPTELAALVHW